MSIINEAPPVPKQISPPPGYEYDDKGNIVATKQTSSPIGSKDKFGNVVATPAAGGLGVGAGMSISAIDFTRAFEDLATDIKRKPSVFINSKVTGRQTILDEGMVMSTDLSAVNKTEQTMRSVATLISGMSVLSSANKLSYGSDSGSGDNTGGAGSATTAGGTGYVSPEGKTFPVGGTPDFSDSWGNPRSGGRTHKGNDLMAPKGTPVLAIADGTIFKTTPTWSPGNPSLGGISVWLRDTNGTTYYYAHLNAIAGGIGVGTNVRVGQVIAFVGNTGNAYPGASHVHFEIHPGGGGAVDPYKILRSLMGK